MSKVRLGLAAALAVAALAFATSAVGAVTRSTAAGGGDGLSKHERLLVAKARLAGERTVTLLIASKPGASGEVAAALGAAGASIGYRDNELGYVRAAVPTERVDRVLGLSGVEAVDVDEVLPVDEPRPEGNSPVIPQEPPGAGTPRSNPYLPTRDTGAAQFVDANPTLDGRGVTIGIVDTGVSLDHPSLLTTSTGEPKIVDWVTGTDPVTDSDPTWLDMETQVSGAAFAFGGVTYTAPAAGDYRIGLFDERDPRLAGEIGRDVNRDGNPTGSSGIFAVLWDPSTNRVWVDTDQDNSFADQTAMTDYKVERDVGHFGTDDPATAVVERMPFVVQTDGSRKFVNIGIASGAHASHVTGIAVGNSLFGGAMSGAAPGAKVVSSRACLFVSGCTAHALFEGMLYVAKQANVDVINMSIGGLPALNDGNNARCILYDRLIEQQNVQMYLSIGNSGPGLNTAGDPGLCGKALGIGAYISSETYARDYGTPMPFEDNLHYFSSRGPREDGGLVPELVAPGAAISSTPLWQPSGPVPGTYTLPPGYSMFNGTSMAAPQAAGAGALLVGAAKRAGVQHQPAQIRQALISSARYLADGRYKPFDQGNGLIDVAGAWNLLSQRIQAVDIVSSVPVNTALSAFLADAGVGTGIYDREGVTTGTTYTRRYTFVRRSGPGRPITYDLSWVGDTAAFGSPSSITLPKDAPVTLDVLVNPATAGVHSAILNLDDPSTPGIEYQTANTVVAPDVFTADNGYSVTKSGSLGRGQQQRYFARIPTGVPALKADFSGPDATGGTGQARFLRWHPFGLGIDSNAVSNCYTPPAGTCTTGSPTSRSTTDPAAGVWETSVDARRTSDNLSGAPYTVAMSILGASVSPDRDVIASAIIGTPVVRSYTFRSLFATFTGKASGTTLGSARRGPFRIGHLEQQQYPVAVTQGSTSLRATIGSPSDPGADLDLFVFNCTSGSCVLAGQSADGDSEESVTINNPAAGAWLVLVDGFDVPAGTTEYDYVDVFVNPAFGGVAVTDADAVRATGATWTAPGTVTANAAPAAGRVLLGNVQVRTDANVLVGSGDVVVQSVTP
jgi:Subtilase family